MRGCEAPAPAPVCDLNGEPFYRCPWTMLTPTTVEILNTDAALRIDGLPPVPGGLWDQSAPFVQGCRILRQERADRLNAEQRAREARSGR